MEELLNSDDRKKVLYFVRKLISSELSGEKKPSFPDCESPVANEKCGCFVTLHTISGQLRGCIGSIVSNEPLHENIARNALNSAFRDPRFIPLEIHELPEIKIEISILTPLEKVASHNEFEVGVHGVYMRCRGRSAVFLPQVAPEQGWDKEKTLWHLCLKAGLPENAWQSEDAEFFLFRAFVFSEE